MQMYFSGAFEKDLVEQNKGNNKKQVEIAFCKNKFLKEISCDSALLR
jgi:hypothetical protein